MPKSSKSSPKHDASQAALTRALKVIPGGVNSPVRAFGAVGGHPPFMVKGEGAIITDMDGTEYLDYVGSWGPHIAGHAFAPVVDAVCRAAKGSTSFGAPTLGEVELAELIVSAFPAMDQVRLVNSGTEACMSAIRLARGYTGRDLIIKFAGCYHGHSDGLLVSAGSGALTFGKPSSDGVPKAMAELTIVLPYNDVSAVEACFKEHGKRIACIIVEPVAGNMGAVRPERGYLESLRSITEKYDSLLIFDEVMTGFRLAWGGVQNLFNIEPDLTCLGKVVGGGMPLAAFGGRADIMAKLAPTGPVYQAGTLSGNPVAVAAGKALLGAIHADGEFYKRLEVLTARLAFGLEEAVNEAKSASPKFTGYVSRFGSMITLFFCDGPVRDLDSASTSDGKRFATFHQDMLKRGVYLPASQYEAWFMGNAHSFDQVDATIAAARDVLLQMAGA